MNNFTHQILNKVKTETASINSSTSQFILSTLQVILASCFIGICSQIKIPLYFTPVPLIVTNAAILLVSALLGYRKGALAVLGYFTQGFFGLPVWAGGAVGGLAYFMGPTGGYLVGYIALAIICGFFLGKNQSYSFSKIMGIFLLASFIQLGIGCLWLSRFVGIENCLALGFFPFIIGDVVKAFFAASLLKYFKKNS
ncbi:MAG: biotin transporter BioY [Parachlamydiaceae bacterium]|nr:biotin transporter BioY [Parachlamydiaceae bacterium]